MGIVERVARAICREGLTGYMVARDGDEGAVEWAKRRFGSVDGYVDAHWPDHRTEAEAAIAAFTQATE